MQHVYRQLESMSFNRDGQRLGHDRTALMKDSRLKFGTRPVTLVTSTPGANAL